MKPKLKPKTKRTKTVSIPVTATVGKFVVVRTYSAGVHCGTLIDWDGGKAVCLTDARRLWRWRGANTLHEVSQKGVSEDWTRLSEAVPSIVLTEVVEVIPTSKAAQENLSRSRWAP